MCGYKDVTFQLSSKTREVLLKFSTSRSLPASLVLRSKIALLASEGRSNPQIIAETGASYTTVSVWRNRFYNSSELIAHAEECMEPDGSTLELEKVIKSILSDEPQLEKDPVLTPEQILLIKKLICRKPEDFGWKLIHWNLPALATEAARQGIAESVSPASIQCFLNTEDTAPWKNCYPLNSLEKQNDLDPFLRVKFSIFKKSASL